MSLFSLNNRLFNEVRNLGRLNFFQNYTWLPKLLEQLIRVKHKKSFNIDTNEEFNIRYSINYNATFYHFMQSKQFGYL